MDGMLVMMIRAFIEGLDECGMAGFAQHIAQDSVSLINYCFRGIFVAYFIL